MNKKTDKRVRLVDAAGKLFYEQGVNVTTLAHIASLAEVPLGNVYYYFKSKESIVLAVIERRRQIMQEQFAALEALGHKDRLKAFIEATGQDSNQVVSFGDWLGSLCQELCKNSGEIANATAKLLNDVLSWCATQFSEMGKGEKSQSLAISLLSSLQGIGLLTLTFKDPKLIEDQNRYLLNWLEKV